MATLQYSKDFINLSECSLQATGTRVLVEVFPAPPSEGLVVKPSTADRDYPLTGRIQSVGEQVQALEPGDLVVLSVTSGAFYHSVDGNLLLIDQTGVGAKATGPVYEAEGVEEHEAVIAGEQILTAKPQILTA